MDSISTMPDEILCHILSFLPSKDAIRTTILSSRWTNLMIFVPVLSFESPPTRIKSFIITLNKLLSSSNSANLGKLKLHMNSYRWGIIKFHINGWINSAIKRNVVSLDVRVPDFLSNATQNRDLALRITASDSLQILKYSGGLRFLMPCTTGSFKNLKKFKVELNDPDKELLAKLFCSLPQLEKLSLKINFSEFMENDMNISINIIVPALKRLSLSITQHEKESVGLKILIDVPLLEYISIEEDYVATYLVKSPPAVVKATLYVCQIQENLDPEDDLDLFYRVVGLLDGLSSAKSLSIVRETTLLLQVVEFAESELPLLHGLTYLELDDMFLSGLALVHRFLDSAPNLKKVLLTILEEYDSDFNWTSFNTIPTSLLNIEEFEIVGAEKVQSVPYWKEMADDIIQNAKVLKKFVVDGQDWCSIA